MAKQRFKTKIGYLYKRNPKIKNATVSFADADTHSTEGIPFYCDVKEKTYRVQEPMSNMYRAVTETVVFTDAELDFEQHDRIAFVKNPVNDVNQQDFSSIMSAVQKPRLEKGSKYRTRDIYTWELRIS